MWAAKSGQCENRDVNATAMKTSSSTVFDSRCQVLVASEHETERGAQSGFSWILFVFAFLPILTFIRSCSEFQFEVVTLTSLLRLPWASRDLELELSS